MMSTCTTGSSSHIYKLSQSDLSTEGETVIPDARILTLVPDNGELIYGGSEHKGCEVLSESPLVGRIAPDLAWHAIWHDPTPFYGYIVAIDHSQRGYVAVATMNESLSVEELKINTDGTIAMKPIVIKKHSAAQSTSLTEAVIIDLDNAGALTRKRFIGNGLPMFPLGMVSEKRHRVLYGSDGFNPWLLQFN